MEQLSGMDASFVYLDTPNSPMHIGSVAIYDPSTAPNGFVRFKDILSHVEARLDGARSFRQKLVRVPFDLDHPYWVEDSNFDLEYHIRHMALPAPGDWRQLCIQVARLHARPMDLTKPLWEFNIVEGLDNIPGIPKGSFALVSKVHHAAIDGMSGVEMTSAIHDLEPAPKRKTSVSDWKPEKDPGVSEMLFRTWTNSLRQPVRFAKTVANTVPGLTRLGKGVIGGDVSLKGAGLAPKSIFNGSVSPHRVFDGTIFKLDDIRAIKDGIDGATVNDVILAIIGGGLRDYLLSRDSLPKKNMVAMAPISVRSENEKGALGNQVSAMTVRLGTEIADPVERLQFVHRESQNSKAMTNAVGARTLSEYSQFTPSALAGLAARLYSRTGAANMHAPPYNCVATNVPGPRVPIYFAGAKLVRIMGMGPVLDGMGLINTIYSYGPEIAISFTSDRNIMPDPAQYAAALSRSFDALFAATVGSGKAKVRTAKKPVLVPAKKPSTSKSAVKKAPAKKAAPTKTVKRKSPPRKPAVKKTPVKN